MAGAPDIVTGTEADASKIAALAARWRDGVPAKLIAHAAGMRLDRLYELARRHRAHFPSRKPGWTAAEIDEAVARWARGHQIADLAEYFDRPQHSVKSMMKKHRARFAWRYRRGAAEAGAQPSS